MNWTLAVTGKGGVGKTTVAAMAVRWLGEQGYGPVLAVDADPNICLDAALGVKIVSAVGSVREEVRQIAGAGSTSTGGMGKQQLLEMKIEQSLIEADRFDLIAMGRPEGPGCYCYANNVLSAAVRRLAGSYPSVVIDNEAGLENLSRRIIQRVDHLIFVSDASLRGLETAHRLYELTAEMGIDAGVMSVVLNRVRGMNPLDRAVELFKDTPVAVAGALPEDGELADANEVGDSILHLPPANPVYVAASNVFASLTRNQPE